jgi:hypothetical protein
MYMSAAYEGGGDGRVEWGSAARGDSMMHLLLALSMIEWMGCINEHVLGLFQSDPHVTLWLRFTTRMVRDRSSCVGGGGIGSTMTGGARAARRVRHAHEGVNGCAGLTRCLHDTIRPKRNVRKE